jgi:hypothetical protein
LHTKKIVSIPVPDGLYNVSVYRKGGGQIVRNDFQPADNAAVLCDYFNPHNETSCTLYVNYTVPG